LKGQVQKIRKEEPKMRKVLSLMVAVILISGGFYCGNALGQAKPISLKLAHINVAEGMLDKHAKKFAELVASKTKGRVKVDVYPASQLGNMTEMLEGVSLGTINMCLESEGMLLIFDKDYQIFQTPFLVTKEIIVKNKFIKELRERVRAKNNIRVLAGQGWRPPFHLWTQKRGIKTPDELQGIKIRQVQSKVQIDVWNGLGATAVPIPWGEVYMALAQGIVNGMVHNIVQVYEEKLYEQLNYCTLLDCLMVWQTVLINDKVYAGLSPDLQKAMNDSAIEAGNYFTDLASSIQGDARKNMEKSGIKFIQTDRKPWFKKALAVAKKLENDGAWTKGLLKNMGY
jgi:TRAP-type C4-dicarboxylate transport system substrate-binding protein